MIPRFINYIDPEFDTLLTRIIKYEYLEKLEEMMLHCSQFVIGPDCFTWNCEVGSITINFYGIQSKQEDQS